MLLENLARLQACPELVQDLEQCRPALGRVQVSLAPVPSLVISGTQVHPADDPMGQAARESAELVRGKPCDLILFFGLGLGLHPSFLRKFSPAPIIVFEPDLEVIHTVLSQLPLELERVTLVSNLSQFSQALNGYLGGISLHLIAGALPTWPARHPQPFSQFKEAIEQALQTVEIQHRTRAAYSVEWLGHMADNLPTYIGLPDLQALGTRFAHQPAILVGAGPSLDKNLDILGQLKGRALICAVHSAVRPLLKNGIVPDLAVILEGQDLVHYFTGGEGLDRITLAASVQTHPKHLRLGFRHIMGLSIEGNATADWMQQAFGIEPLPSSASVSSTSLSMLHALGCDPLVLVGMDCALTGNRTHSGQSIQRSMRLGKPVGQGRMSFDVVGETTTGEWEVHEVEAWGGQGTEYARGIYSIYRQWFEGIARIWANQHTLINATEGGARINGFHELTLAQVRDRFCPMELPAEDIIHECLQKATPLPAERLAETMATELETIARAGAMADRARQAADEVLGLLEARRLDTVQPALDQLQLLEKELQKITRTTRLLNTLVGYKAVKMTGEKATPEDRVEATIESVKKSRQISNLIVSGAEELTEQFRPVVISLRDSS